MGLFGFGKRRPEDSNVFLKEHAVKVNGLLVYADNNEKVKNELIQLKDDFQYTMPSPNRAAKGIEKKIIADFKKLTTMLQQPEWAEEEVLLLVKGLRRYIVEISSLMS